MPSILAGILRPGYGRWSHSDEDSVVYRVQAIVPKLSRDGAHGYPRREIVATRGAYIISSSLPAASADYAPVAT